MDPAHYEILDPDDLDLGEFDPGREYTFKTKPHLDRDRRGKSCTPGLSDILDIDASMVATAGSVHTPSPPLRGRFGIATTPFSPTSADSTPLGRVLRPESGSAFKYMPWRSPSPAFSLTSAAVPSSQSREWRESSISSAASGGTVHSPLFSLQNATRMAHPIAPKTATRDGSDSDTSTGTITTRRGGERARSVGFASPKKLSPEATGGAVPVRIPSQDLLAGQELIADTKAPKTLFFIDTTGDRGGTAQKPLYETNTGWRLPDRCSSSSSASANVSSSDKNSISTLSTSSSQEKPSSASSSTPSRPAGKSLAARIGMGLNGSLNVTPTGSKQAKLKSSPKGPSPASSKKARKRERRTAQKQAAADAQQPKGDGGWEVFRQTRVLDSGTSMIDLTDIDNVIDLTGDDDAMDVDLPIVPVTPVVTTDSRPKLIDRFVGIPGHPSLFKKPTLGSAQMHKKPTSVSHSIPAHGTKSNTVPLGAPNRFAVSQAHSTMPITARPTNGVSTRPQPVDSRRADPTHWSRTFYTAEAYASFLAEGHQLGPDKNSTYYQNRPLETRLTDRYDPSPVRPLSERTILVGPVPDDIVAKEIASLLIKRVGAVDTVKIQDGTAVVTFQTCHGERARKLCKCYMPGVLMTSPQHGARWT